MCSRARVWAREPFLMKEGQGRRRHTERERERYRPFVAERGKMRKPVSCDVGGTFMRRRAKQNRVHMYYTVLRRLGDLVAV